MAHSTVEPDGQVAPNMHGFDPLPKPEAVALINGFTTINPIWQIDVTQNSFYIDAETLTDLLKGERTTNSDYQAIRVMFGIDAANRIVLLINRVTVTEEVKNVREFTYVPQIDSIVNVSGEHELIEYALLTVNTANNTELHRIDINGDDYYQFRLNFQERFATDNLLTTYKISAKSMQSALEFETDRPTVIQFHPLITGYYIGWGTLELIRQEITHTKQGIKLFLGYGRQTLNPNSARCLHLVAIAANSVQDTIDAYHKTDIWSTQDQTKPSRKFGQSALSAPIGFPIPARTRKVYRKLTAGSSCQDESTETTP